MKISDMNIKIDILTKENDDDSPFGSEYTAKISSIWAKKEQLAGSQLTQAIGEGNKIPCNFIIRRNDSINNKMCVKCKDVLYDIVSATPLNNNDTFTILTCLELEG